MRRVFEGGEPCVKSAFPISKTSLWAQRFWAPGGGGDPYIGKLLAIGAVKECGEVSLIDVDELSDDDVVVPVASVGAPTILTEKGVGSNEFTKLIDMVGSYYGKKITAIMPIEAGGVNSMLPIAAAARLGLPMVDVDGMGRAFPEIQMVTFTIGGVSASLCSSLMKRATWVLWRPSTTNGSRTFAVPAAPHAAGSVVSTEYVMTASQVREFGVRGIVTRSQELGRAIRGIKNCPENMTPEEYFFDYTGGFRLFKGKIADVLRETRGGFNFGKVVLEGIGEDKGGHAEIDFQNENLCATVNGEILGHDARPHLPGRHRNVHARAHRRVEVRQARAGRWPSVLPLVAHREGH